MTNWCAVILTGYVCLAFFGCAISLKCYKCGTATEEECTKNQTLVECQNPILHCTIAKYVELSQVYIKHCFPPSISCRFFNMSGQVTNCTVSTCSSDYCNGPAPTTSTPSAVPSTDPYEPTSKPTTPTGTQKKDARSAGNIASSASGLIASLFVSVKILEMFIAS